MLSDTDRKRHEHMSQKGKIMNFVVQYETLIEKKWVPIVRYDNAHGYAHKDLLKPGGGKEKIFLGIGDLNQALTFADKDVNENWKRYKNRYLWRMKK